MMRASHTKQILVPRVDIHYQADEAIRGILSFLSTIEEFCEDLPTSIYLYSTTDC